MTAAAITVTTSAISDGQVIDAADVLVPIAQLKQSIEDTLNGVQAVARLSFGAPESLTIASGVITITQSNVVVDTQAAAAADDLDTINGGANGRWLMLRCANAARVVTVKHGTGNIVTTNEMDYTLDTSVFVLCLHNGTNWVAVITPRNEYSNLGTPSVLTISGGAVTRSRTRHYLDTEGGAGYDELANILGGTNGDEVYLLLGNASHIIKVKHGTGNIRLSHAADRTFIDYNQPLHLVFDSSANTWSEPGLDTRAFLPTTNNGYFFGEYASAATYAQENMAAGTAVGAGAVTNANEDDGIYTSVAIAASAGTFGGRRTTTYNLTRRSHNPSFEAVIKTHSDITNTRLWIGLFSAAPTNVDAIAAGTLCAAFRYSSVAGDAGWIGVTNDGSSQTETAAVAAIAASTLYKLRIRWDATNSRFLFSVDDGLPLALNATLPTASTDLGIVVTAITTTASAKAFKISRYGCYSWI